MRVRPHLCEIRADVFILRILDSVSHVAQRDDDDDDESDMLIKSKHLSDDEDNQDSKRERERERHVV